MQDEGLGFAGACEAGFGEDVGNQRAGVGSIFLRVGVVDVDGNLRHVEKVFNGEGDGAAFEGHVKGF